MKFAQAIFDGSNHRWTPAPGSPEPHYFVILRTKKKAKQVIQLLDIQKETAILRFGGTIQEGWGICTGRLREHRFLLRKDLNIEHRCCMCEQLYYSAERSALCSFCTKKRQKQ